jgi:general secretion pathway protein D
MKQKLMIALMALSLLGAGGISSQAMAAVQTQKGQKGLSPNFKDVDIRKVIEAVAKMTNHNFVIDPRVKGKVTLISPEPMSQETLYQTLLAILRVHGYVAIPDGEVTKVVPANLARDQVPYVTPAVKKSEERDAWVTEVIAVHNVEATKLVAILRPLVAREGHLVGLAESNRLIVTDTLSNIARIKKIIQRIDVPTPTQYEMIPLKNASAQEIAKTLKGVLPANQKSVKITFDERSNRLIVTGPQEARLQIRAMVADLDVPVPSEGNVSVVYLRYAKASDLVPVLQKVANSPSLINSAQAEQGAPENSVAKGKKAPVKKTPVKTAKEVAKEINIQADERMNAVIISAPPIVVTALKNVIKQLDVRRAQVLIEAVLVEISEAKQAELGVEWAANGPNGLGIINFSGTLPALLGNAGNPAAQAQAVGRGMLAGAGEISTDNRGWAALVKALNGDSDANILSTPTLLTLDNEEAEIIVGKEVPFQTGSYVSTGGGTTPSNPFQTIERKNVGLKLKVKPQINEGDEIYLEINQELSDVLPKSDAVDLETSKREIKTNVIVGDGNVIVLGGLLTERETEVVSKVPGLGDIPFLGALFRSKSNQREKVNLMMFLRPVIVRNNKMSNYYSQQKYGQMYKKQSDLLQRYDSGMLNGLRPKMRTLEEWKQGQDAGDANKTDGLTESGMSKPVQKTKPVSSGKVNENASANADRDSALEVLGF